jgi:hypothetical protein
VILRFLLSWSAGGVRPAPIVDEESGRFATKRRDKISKRLLKAKDENQRGTNQTSSEKHQNRSEV